MTRTLRDSEQCLQRMEALVRRMAAQAEGRIPIAMHDDLERNEARAIVAELDAPQSDEEWARHLREEYMNDGHADSITPTLLKAIAKGRELERNKHGDYGLAAKRERDLRNHD